jgi:two-component system KDP operon response regulator KdpE
MKGLILIIEDDPAIRKFLRATLAAEDYQYFESETAEDGMVQVNTRRPDLLLLDLGLPDCDGLEVIRHVRQTSEMPIVVLSARGQEKDKVAALDLGADDYIEKPFAVGELLARIRAAMRRAGAASTPGAVLRFGRVEFDVDRRAVRVNGEDVHLTPHEFKLFQMLIKHAGKVLTHRQLLIEVWGPNQIEQPQYLRVYIAQLRRKLEIDPARPKHLRTEPGVGYRLVME